MKLLFITIFYLTYAQAFSQLEKVATLNLNTVQRSSVDRLGNFYFVLESEKILKVNPDGKTMDETTSDLPITLIEPWNPLKVFVYSYKSGHYQFFDHHLKLLEDHILEPSLSITPKMVCPSNEVNKAWILDAADFTLKKVNLSTNEIEIDTPLPADWAQEDSDFVFMREYQNRVFLLDRNKGILMLNKLGIKITGIEIKGLNFFNFNGEELCYRKGNQILLTDLITGDVRTVATLPTTQNVKEIIITDERLAVVMGERVEIYRLKPAP